MSGIMVSTNPQEPMDNVLAALDGPPTITITISGGPAKDVQAIGYAMKNSIIKNFIVPEKIKDAKILININTVKGTDEIHTS